MTDTEHDHPVSELPQAIQAKRWRWAPWLIWLIPIIALVIGGSILVQSLRARGPSVTILFKSAEGLEAGKTRIKYKDVDIGTVRRISLSDDRKQVIVSAQLVKNAESFLHEDSRFWVVRPRIGAGGISGLGTLLSGSYIGVDAGKSSKERDEFTGLDLPPFVLTGLAGKLFILHTDQIGSIDIGAPIFYRHIQVGQVAAYELNGDGSGVNLHVFVNAPYDKFVTTATRFWKASGIELSVDASGAKLNTESLSAIISGGISFAVPDDLPPAPAAANNADFALYANRDVALKHADNLVRKAVVYFNESVRDLTVGAPVDFRGIVIGEVTGIRLDYNAKTRNYSIPVEIDLYPERLNAQHQKSATPATNEDLVNMLDTLVQKGLRAQLKTGSLLTGKLFVALDFFPETPAFKIDWSADRIVVATVPSKLEELQTILTRIARRADKVPLDKISADVRKVLASLDTSVKHADKLIDQLDAKVAPSARATLEQARKTLQSAEGVLASDAPLQQDLRDTLRDLSRTAQSVRDLTDYLERHPESLLRGKKENP